MNAEIRGWNECLIAYVLAASAPRYPIDQEVYHRGWADGRRFPERREFYGIDLPLGPDYGGPLFFVALFVPRPRSTRPERPLRRLLGAERRPRADQSRALRPQPARFQGLRPGLLGADRKRQPSGAIAAHAPDVDVGVISPTAALSSLPVRARARRCARSGYFYHELGDRIWGDYGFVDAFSETDDWHASSYLAIDQGPIVVMIENYRTGLLWNLFMSCPEIRQGLRRLDFESPHLAVTS